MANFDFDQLPSEPSARRAALFNIILNRADAIDEDASTITSVALAGALYAKGDESRNDDGDAVSLGLFGVIRRYSENSTPIQELRAAVIALRDGISE